MKKSKLQRTTVCNQVLARRDMNKSYCKENCYWRDPVNDWEARTGIEQLSPLEPDEIPLTEEEKKVGVPKNVSEQMYNIWRRIKWRTENYPLR